MRPPKGRRKVRVISATTLISDGGIFFGHVRVDQVSQACSICELRQGVGAGEGASVKIKRPRILPRRDVM